MTGYATNPFIYLEKERNYAGGKKEIQVFSHAALHFAQ
jgi:hypothetical protein